MPDRINEADFKPLVSEPSRPSTRERQWAVGCHLIALSGIILPIPSVNFIGPLVIWLIKRMDSAYIDQQGKEALNFQISLFIYELICIALMFLGIGFLLFLPLLIFGFVCVIIAAIKAGEGVEFRYPACIRFIK